MQYNQHPQGEQVSELIDVIAVLMSKMQPLGLLITPPLSAQHLTGV